MLAQFVEDLALAGVERRSSSSITRSLCLIGLPHPFQGLRHGLAFNAAFDMASAFGPEELVVIALGFKGVGHIVVVNSPVAELVVEVIGADFHPDAEGFFGGVGDQAVLIFLGAFGGGLALLDLGEAAGVADDAGERRACETRPSPWRRCCRRIGRWRHGRRGLG